MIILAIDTSERRGSVAVLRERDTVASARHDQSEDYSAWLLPATQRVLMAAGISMDRVELFAAATGPGSFTGVRVGLTTLKGWSEVYRRPVVGVSRLEAMASLVDRGAGLVAPNYDAQRGQLFGAIYEESRGQLQLVGDEVVAAPAQFGAMVDREAGNRAVTWMCLDPGLIENVPPVPDRLGKGDRVVVCSEELASAIGAVALERASKGQWSDPLALDANYVRRSDAEIIWKDRSSRVR